MGSCHGLPKQLDIEYEKDECPICYDKMMKNPWATSDQTFNCQKCNKLFHNRCWCRCINIDGKCPWCRQIIIPHEHMQTILFSQAHNRMNGLNEEHHLCTTYVFCLSENEIGEYGIETICYSHN